MKVVRLYVFLYNLLWTLIISPWIPFLLLSENSRTGKRLFFSLPNILTEKESIWIHALSVGEVISAIPLYRALKGQFPDKRLIFTVKTGQGMEVASEALSKEDDASLFPMPLDFWWPMRKLVRLINPCLLIIVETDIWPGLIHYLKTRGIKVLVVNGRISPRTFNSYKRFGFLSSRILDCVDLFLMQSELDRKRLLEIGLSPDRVITSGNLKFDRVRPPISDEEKAGLRHELGFENEVRIWVAGSTHEDEHVQIIDVFMRLIPDFPDLRLVIAPRDTGSAQTVYEECRSREIRVFKRTDSIRSQDDCQILILNTIGELGRIYGISEISFVGGSLVPVGGHNLLEPASFGSPVLFGPHTHNFEQMSELLIETGGGIRVNDTDDLYSGMYRLLSDRHKLELMGNNAKKFVEANRGALGRILEKVRSFI